MLATLQMNAMGHIHIWSKKVEVEKIAKYNYTANGSESAVYLQADYDITALQESIPADIWSELDKGYTVQADIDSLYFGE